VITRIYLVIWLALGLGLATNALAAPPAAPASAPATASPMAFEGFSPAGSAKAPALTLKGKHSGRQMMVTGKTGAGNEYDLTRQVVYRVSPTNIVAIDASGWVTPLADGNAQITALSSNGTRAEISLAVANTGSDPTINFPNQIVPIFTKTGCNAGGCHGKASGQNGFKLSLLGFEPAEDYEHLVKEARGRRVFPAAPEQSLLLLKARAALPHGGGSRLSTESTDYQLLVRWIAQGMPYGQTNDPTVTRIEVFPRARTLQLESEQQLAVLAYYTDGSVEDVTRSALYEPNDKGMARASETGLIQLFKQPGDVAVMIRYQGKVAVFRATLPLGAPVDSLPAPRNFIDELVFKKLRTIGIPPSDLCDDSTFLRRVSLDIAGRLPSLAETQRYLADPAPDKRQKFVDALLSSGDYADYFANKWSALLRNKRADAKQARGTYSFYLWIRDSLFDNKPYHQFVREILAASGDLAEHPPVAWYRQARDTTTQLEDTAQLFLGTRLQCAQCHHHPFEKWSQQDYFSFAAFFAQLGRKPGSQPGEEIIFHKRGTATATNKKTKQAVKPAGLGGIPLELPPESDPREALVDWMTSPDNPFFARSLVNRYWKHFFNRGLVDPEDDLRETNPATNPELLDALARHFVQHQFNLKELIRTLCNSRIYQLSSVPNAHNQVDKQHFSRYYPKRLTAEVLLDALNLVTQSENRFEGLPTGVRAVQLPDNSFNASSYFLTVFGRPDMASSCECERSQDASLAQSLHLLNSKEVQEKLTAETGRAAALARDSKTAEEEKLRQLYLLAFARPPDDKELKLARDYLSRKTGKDEAETMTLKRQGFEDLIWALINAKEFLFNH
jgi:hypothetical protein